VREAEAALRMGFEELAAREIGGKSSSMLPMVRGFRRRLSTLASRRGGGLMLQLFLRARIYNLLRSISDEREFRTRSADRDAETDRARIVSIMTALQEVLDDAEKEKVALGRRVDGALARAAVTLGNSTDEYLDRDPRDDYHQSLFNLEISNGERRLSELATMISHLKFIKSAMLTRFPDPLPPLLGNARGK
jgi:hypothetical protein